MAQHAPHFSKAGRREERHPRDRGEIRHIKQTVVGLAVFSHQSSTVYAEDHMEAKDRHIVEQHIIPALQKRGVHGKDRQTSLLGHSSRHRHGVPLRNPHIEKSFRELSLKGAQSGAVPHGSSHRTDSPILRRQLADSLSKRAGKGGPGGLQRLTCLDTKP